jgi:uncharacterized protein (TIGR02147 family)
MFSKSNYREVLRDELTNRIQKNSKYSLRAFARDLDISNSMLSEILNKKKMLSTEKARSICKNLNLSDLEVNYFIDLVTIDSNNTSETQMLAKNRVSKAKLEGAHYTRIEKDRFEMISNWYYFVILELCKIKDISHDAAVFSNYLGLTVIETEEAIERLVRLGFITISHERYNLENPNNSTTSDVSSESLKKYHSQYLEKAIHSQAHDDVDMRMITNVVTAMNSKKIPELKKRIFSFLTEMDQLIGEDIDNSDQVYALNIQLVPVTKRRET